jgi:hypothetical protein
LYRAFPYSKVSLVILTPVLNVTQAFDVEDFGRFQERVQLLAGNLDFPNIDLKKSQKMKSRHCLTFMVPTDFVYDIPNSFKKISELNHIYI